MKIQFQQSGGVVGAIKGCELDTQMLAPEPARELERLVQASGFTSPFQLLSDSARDLHQYEITVEDGKRRVAVVFDDVNVPQLAKPLLGFLKRYARPQALR